MPTRRTRVLLLMAASGLTVTSCGGGGGGGGSSGPPPPPPVTASFAVTPNTVSMSAASPNTPITPGPFVKGTVTGNVTGTLYINVVIAGPAVKAVGDFTIAAGSNSGTAEIIPQDAWGLGVGNFASTLTVHACQGDQTCKTGELIGSPQVVNVSYTIGSSITSVTSLTVSPFEVASGTSGDIVLRSGGWGAIAPATSLSIGSNAALAFTHPDANTFTLTYPALAAGPYPVKTNNGDLLGNLTVVDIPVFSAATLSYPSIPGEIADVLYDPDNQALIVTTRNTDSSTNQLLSYAYSNGAWSPPVTTAWSGLRHAVPMVSDWVNPSYALMIVADTYISYYLAAGTTLQSTFAPEIFTGGAYSNAGYYLLTLETPASSGVQLATFGGPGSLPFGIVFPTPASAGAFPQPTIAGSADGSLIVVLAASGATAKIAAYDSTHELLSDTAAVFNHNGTGRVPALDRRATRIVVSNDAATNVYDASFNVLGALPATTQAYVVNSNGTRVYTYDGTPQILTFDVSSTANGSAYTPLGPPVPVPPVGGSPRMSISLDDRTVFVAGTNQVVVQPVP